MSQFETEASRWAAVQSRDPSADGKFVYCVKTTQIYCRPICKARLARRSNVTFQDNSLAAEAGGFRPCLRCKPELDHYDPQAEMIANACSTIRLNSNLNKETSLRELATQSGLTESHFHRVFKSVMGTTPKAYAGSLLSKTIKNEDLSSSPPDNLTPSFDHSSSASSGPLTPGVASSGLPFGWTISNPWEGIEAPVGRDPNPPAHQSDIEFTIQPWSSGYVLVAAANNHVRAIDVSDSYAELVARLQQKFPAANLLLSDWSRSTHDPFRTPNQLLFESVMEALEKPSGKMLNLGPNVFDTNG